ncbi:Hypothetical protein POVN_LOCUS540 [uncultured virus]|nr:Hypothetical protein POVN_LOCUS540 [uncultured virus]
MTDSGASKSDRKVPNAIAYRFDVDGGMTRLAIDAKVADIGDVWKHVMGNDNCFLHIVGTFGEADLWLVMHEDNDLDDTFKASELKTNKALQQYYPASQYKGDLLVVQTWADSDELYRKGWDLGVLSKHIATKRVFDADHHLAFELKETAEA